MIMRPHRLGPVDRRDDRRSPACRAERQHQVAETAPRTGADIEHAARARVACSGIGARLAGLALPRSSVAAVERAGKAIVAYARLTLAAPRLTAIGARCRGLHLHNMQTHPRVACSARLGTSRTR